MSRFWIGVAGAVATGLLWATVGIVLSRAARRGIAFAPFMAANFSMAASVAFLVYPRHQVWLSGDVACVGPLVAAIIGGGLISALGVICTQRGMQLGHHGATWTISQSGLAIPFLAGLLIWSDHARVGNIVGAAAILSGLVLLGYTRDDGEAGAPRHGIRWLLFALFAFLAIGTAQTCMGIPSRWAGWTDEARLRVPLFLIGSLLGHTIVTGLQGHRVRKGYSREAVLLAVIGLVSQFLMFRTLDVFAEFHRVGLAHPIAVGTCIVGFGLYSILVLRERINLPRLAGLILAALGVVLVALK
jgi:multidrug transporter EmrE-like cation transporter